MTGHVLRDAEALEASLNAQFAADGVPVTTTVQELRAAPEYVAILPSEPPPPPPDNVAILIMLISLMLVVVVAILLLGYSCAFRSRAYTAPAQPAVPVGLPVDPVRRNQFNRATRRRSSGPEGQQLPEVQGAVLLDVAPPKTLAEMSDIFKEQLGVSGTMGMAEVVKQACEQLDVETNGKNVIEQARAAYAKMMGLDTGPGCRQAWSF